MRPIVNQPMFYLDKRDDHFVVQWIDIVRNHDLVAWTNELSPTKTRWERVLIRLKGGDAVLPVLSNQGSMYVPWVSIEREIIKRHRAGKPEALHD